jgi:hypothetical protein
MTDLLLRLCHIEWTGFKFGFSPSNRGNFRWSFFLLFKFINEIFTRWINIITFFSS